MSAQLKYGFSTPKGFAGAIVDLAPYAIDTFLNEEEVGKMKFGAGVVQGTKPGSTIKMPVAESTAAVFEGIATNNHTTEYDLEGKVTVKKGAAVGVMRYGKIYARVASGQAPVYGDALHLVVSGDDAGCFAKTGGIAVKGRFLGPVDATTGVAPVELFNEAQ